jgi:rhomboid family GlyGly-CTERM serine protease
MKVPVWTLLLCSVAAVVFVAPSLGDALIYDRDAISGGEWWRLITGNLVHLSAMHLTFDALALLVAGTIMELRGDRYVGFVYFMAGAVVGVVVYVTSPELQYYGGLSGVVTAVVVYLCLEGLRDTGGWRWLCLFGMTLVAVKIGIEFRLGKSLLAATVSQPFVPVPVSHLAGAFTAFFAFGMTRWKQVFTRTRQAASGQGKHRRTPVLRSAASSEQPGIEYAARAKAAWRD